MKVILLRDVAKLGRRHAVIEVPDGFALNKLIPQKMATPATPENLKKVLARAEHIEQSAAEKSDKFAELLAAVATIQFEIPVDANAQDHLFKAVKAVDIVGAMAQKGFVIESESIKLTDPIKTLGQYNVAVAQGSLAGTITINVIRK